MFTAGQGPVFAPVKQGTGQTVPAVCAVPTLLEWGWLPPNPESQLRSCPGNELPDLGRGVGSRCLARTPKPKGDTCEGFIKRIPLCDCNGQLHFAPDLLSPENLCH